MTCGGRKERKQERNEAGRANGTVAVAAGGDSSIGPGYRLALSGCSHSLARRLATSCKRLAKQKASDGETIKSLLTQQIIPPLRRAVDSTANKQ